MMQTVLGSVRPSVIGGAWVALASGADWIPGRVLAVITAGLFGATIAAAARLTDKRDKALLIRAVAQRQDVQHSSLSANSSR